MKIIQFEKKRKIYLNNYAFKSGVKIIVVNILTKFVNA